IKNFSTSTVGASFLIPFQRYSPLVKSTGTGRLPGGAAWGTTSHDHCAPLSLTNFWIGRMLPGWLEYIPSCPLLKPLVGPAPGATAAFCFVTSPPDVVRAARLAPSSRASFVRSLLRRSPPRVRRMETEA